MCQVEESLEGMPIQFGQARILDSVHVLSMKETLPDDSGTESGNHCRGQQQAAFGQDCWCNWSYRIKLSF